MEQAKKIKDGLLLLLENLVKGIFQSIKGLLSVCISLMVSDVCLQGCVMLPHVLMEVGVQSRGTGCVSVLLGSKGHDASTVSFLYRVTKQH